jgi:hypothetical protein
MLVAMPSVDMCALEVLGGGDNQFDGDRKTCMLRGLVFKYETIADSLVETG